MNEAKIYNLKLFMIMLGSKPSGRQHTEPNDIFFGISTSPRQLIAEARESWPEGRDKVHVGSCREVNAVDGYKLKVSPRMEADNPVRKRSQHIFFVNLGGYQNSFFGEQHHNFLSVGQDKASTIRAAKESLFFRISHLETASSHIEDKHGLDSDQIYEIDDMLSDEYKKKYRIDLVPSTDSTEGSVLLAT